ncbi:uncharacterized protein F5891DRAFT_986318 [Suillus fuscotomentosus]|uniref:Uncharacterized protein n=1 Tax=Suillus fuscotomentosus TaxID=1912939 RepID=A0AAD4DS55_9AGAM|nr:uncharacterized protein F5891DRAFT_986318 [Suillus fuscotomentosus]KAG1892940.1 hypothetical protein F5891DRAFT_986318 [Suillus fuscotomentosus]
MYFNEYNVYLGQEMLNTQLMWMGSTMSIDTPESPSGPLRSVQDVSIQSPDVAGDETGGLTVFKTFQAQILMANIASDTSSSQDVGHLSLKKRELVCSLKKVINKYLRRHCEGGHPTTDLLCEHIYAALEGALLGMEVDDIMSKHYSKGAEKPRTNDNRDVWRTAHLERHEARIIFPQNDSKRKTMFVDWWASRHPCWNARKISNRVHNNYINIKIRKKVQEMKGHA